MKTGNNRSWRRQSLCRALLIVALTMMVLPVLMAIVSPSASAMTGEEYAVQNPEGQTLVFFGVIGVVIVVVLYYAADVVFWDSALGILLVVGIVMLLAVPVTLGAFVWMEPSDDDRPPVVIPPTAIRWFVDLDEDGDVDGSTYPAGLFTDVDTAIGGTTGEWITATDNPDVNDVDKRASTTVHVDTDLNYNEALWMEPNAIFIEAALIKLLDGPKSSAGAIETQQYWGRIDSIDHIKPTATDNASGTLVAPIYVDGDYRHHIGWQDENNNWLQACPEYQGQPLPAGGGCGPVPLGDDDTAGDAIKAVATGGIRLFWIWEDRGPFSWSATNGDSWSLTFSIGSEGDWHTYVFTASYTESATNNA